MKQDKFCRIGHALYGENFTPKIARDLGRSHVTVFRWVNGRTRIPDAIDPLLRRIVQAHLAALEEVLRGLR